VCKQSANLYHQAYKAGRRKVVWATRHEANEARAHIDYLTSHGMPCSTIAAHTDISCATLSRIRNGKTTRITRTVAHRILGVGLHLLQTA